MRCRVGPVPATCISTLLLWRFFSITLRLQVGCCYNSITLPLQFKHPAALALTHSVRNLGIVMIQAPWVLCRVGSPCRRGRRCGDCFDADSLCAHEPDFTTTLSRDDFSTVGAVQGSGRYHPHARRRRCCGGDIAASFCASTSALFTI